LLAAAERVLERDGLPGLTLRAVAREAGVSHAAPTHHFGDLTGLLSELAAIGFRRFNEAMIAARNSETHPLMKGMANAKAYVAYAQARPGMYGLMFRTERLDMTRPSLHEAATASFEGLANAVGAGRNEKLSGEALEALSLDQAAAIARAWSLVHGFTTLLLDGAAEGHPAPAAGGHRRRPAATCDAALDRRPAAGGLILPAGAWVSKRAGRSLANDGAAPAHNGRLTTVRQGFTYDQPFSCNSITRTTPDGTICACGMIGMSLPSALRMFSWVLPQALKEISGVLNASTSIRAFTGEVSSRSMCKPGPKVTTSIDTFSPRPL
jgi:AcrR family transcriptional regulator